MPLQEHPAVVLLLEGDLVFWSMAMNECDGHEDLCGSGHRSVIPYVHERTELYYSRLYESEPPPPPLTMNLFSTPVKRCLPDPFIAQGRIVTMRPGVQQVAPRWLKS
jgi:hypothetical protein